MECYQRSQGAMFRPHAFAARYAAPVVAVRTLDDGRNTQLCPHSRHGSIRSGCNATRSQPLSVMTVGEKCVNLTSKSVGNSNALVCRSHSVAVNVPRFKCSSCRSSTNSKPLAVRADCAFLASKQPLLRVSETSKSITALIYSLARLETA